MDILQAKDFFLTKIILFLRKYEIRRLLSLNHEWTSYRQDWIYFQLNKSSSFRFYENNLFRERILSLVRRPISQLSLNLLLRSEMLLNNSIISYVHSIKLSSSDCFNYRHIIDLSLFCHLGFLRIENCQVINFHLPKNIEHITLKNCVTESRIQLSPNYCPIWKFISCASIAVLELHPSIIHIDIYNSPDFTSLLDNQTIKELGLYNVRSFEFIELQYFCLLTSLTISCETLSTIPSLPFGLKHLFLFDCFELRDLPKLPSLTLLWIRSCNKLTEISGFPELRLLKLFYSKIHAIKNLLNLKKIELLKCCFLQTISNCPNLNYLKMETCPQLNLREQDFPVLKKIEFFKRGFHSFEQYFQYRQALLVNG